MTVGELKQLIAGLTDDAEVLVAQTQNNGEREWTNYYPVTGELKQLRNADTGIDPNERATYLVLG